MLMRTFAVMLVALVATSSAHAQTVHVSSPGSVQAALRALAAQFTSETDTKFDFVVGSGGSTLARLKTDVPIDVIALADHELEAMSKAGLLKPETVTLIGSVRVGVAVRAGTPVPDISTLDKLRAAVLAAESVSHSNPKGGSTSGAQVLRVFEQLGIAKEVAQKTKFVGAKGLASGEVAMHFQPISELMQTPGITIVGPLPAELKAGTTLGVAVTARATASKEALAFVRYVARRESAKTFERNGVAPVSQ